MNKAFILFIFLISCQGGLQKNSDLLNCWISSYQPGFNFLDELNDLENKLLAGKIIKNTTIQDYQNFIQQAREDKTENLKNVVVDRYVSEKAFKECVSNQELLTEDERTLKYGILFSIYHTLSREHARIGVNVLSDGGLMVNKTTVDPDQFSEVLKLEIDKRIDKGIPKERIIVALNVESETKMGVISGIQQKMKNLQIKKIEYSSNN